MKKLIVLIALLFCSNFMFASGGSPRHLGLMLAGAESSDQREVLEQLCLVNKITEFTWHNALQGLKKLQSKVESQKVAIKALKGEEVNSLWMSALKTVKKTAKDGVRQANKEHRREKRHIYREVSEHNKKTAMRVAMMGAQHDEEVAQRIQVLRQSCAQKAADLQKFIQEKQREIEAQGRVLEQQKIKIELQRLELEAQAEKFAEQRSRLIEARDSLTVLRQLSKGKDQRLASLQEQLNEATAMVQELRGQQATGQGASISSVVSAMSNFFSS